MLHLIKVAEINAHKNINANFPNSRKFHKALISYNKVYILKCLINTYLLSPRKTYCFPEGSVNKWFIITSSVKVNKRTVNKKKLILLFNDFNSFNIIK